MSPPTCLVMVGNAPIQAMRSDILLLRLLLRDDSSKSAIAFDYV
jgi:hypothetical protein